MAMNPIYLPWALLAAAVLFVGLAARLMKKGADGGINSASRFLLIGLRLVIGWHFLIEGIEKLHSPSWTSEAYLRESSGPLAPTFRALAGDRLIDKLTVGADDTFPAELAIEWRTYVDAFSNYYQLNDEYRSKASAVFAQAKSKTLTWLTSTKQPVQIAGALPPPYTDELTVPQRLERHKKLEATVRAIEADIPKYGPELFAKYKTAKGDLNKWRADLKRDLDLQFQSLKKDLRDGVLLPLLQELVPEPYRAKLTPRKEERDKKEKEWLSTVQGVYHQIMLAANSAKNDAPTLDAQTVRIFVSAFERKQGEQSGDEILPVTPRRPVGAWKLLDWSDAVVKYGLVIVGGCLLAGLITRTACLAGAGFLLMFFLAMPPLPGWPENPRAEGHYLYINKNIIEMFALLALATMRTGRWAGVDGLLQFLRPARWRGASASGNVK